MQLTSASYSEFIPGSYVSNKNNIENYNNTAKSWTAIYASQ